MPILVHKESCSCGARVEIQSEYETRLGPRATEWRREHKHIDRSVIASSTQQPQGMNMSEHETQSDQTEPENSNEEEANVDTDTEQVTDEDAGEAQPENDSADTTE